MERASCAPALDGRRSAFCIAATVSNAAMMTFSGKLLSEKLDVVSVAKWSFSLLLLH